MLVHFLHDSDRVLQDTLIYHFEYRYLLYLYNMREYVEEDRDDLDSRLEGNDVEYKNKT